VKDFNNSTSSYLAYLVQQIHSMSQGMQDKWTQCLSSDRTRHGDPLDCAIEWAKDSEPLNCDFVWKYYEENPTEDLGGRYYERMWPVVERQIIKGGLRMAKWLDYSVRDCHRRTVIKEVLNE